MNTHENHLPPKKLYREVLKLNLCIKIYITHTNTYLRPIKMKHFGTIGQVPSLFPGSVDIKKHLQHKSLDAMSVIYYNYIYTRLFPLDETYKMLKLEMKLNPTGRNSKQIFLGYFAKMQI